MFLLDENITKDQKELLSSAGIRTHQIGFDFHIKGMDDYSILALLKMKRNITFITRDKDFYKQEYCHQNFCIVYADIEKSEVAFYIRRFLKLPFFNTRKKRMGRVVRINQTIISNWKNKTTKEEKIRWIAI